MTTQLWDLEQVEWWDPETVPRWDLETAPTGPEGQPGAADPPIRPILQAEVIRPWFGAIDRAISALGTWRAILAALGAGDGPTDPAALRPAPAPLTGLTWQPGRLSRANGGPWSGCVRR